MKTVNDILTLVKDHKALKVAAGVRPDVSLREQGFDSLDLIMLLYEVEANFAVRIPQEQTNQLTSLQAIADFINQQS